MERSAVEETLSSHSPPPPLVKKKKPVLSYVLAAV